MYPSESYWSPADCVSACKNCMYEDAIKGVVGTTCMTNWGMWW